MSSLREIDHDLDQITVDAALLAEVQKGVAARGKIALASADRELTSLANGTSPRPVAASEPESDAPPSGQIDVPDDVLRSSELPAVLAIDPEPPVTPLALDLEADLMGADLSEGATALDDDGSFQDETDLAPSKTSASVIPPVEAPQTHALEGDDPNADLASLLGDSDPMRDDVEEPPAPVEIEPEPTMMFSAEDAERFSRPAPAFDEENSDLELEVDEIIEIDEEPEAEPAAARPRTAPPPPPRTAPPPPPGARPSEAPQGRGFLGKLLQRKP